MRTLHVLERGDRVKLMVLEGPPVSAEVIDAAAIQPTRRSEFTQYVDFRMPDNSIVTYRVSVDDVPDEAGRGFIYVRIVE
jgi:NAD(P)H-flavin reductase